ncbi:MAG: protein kinase [Acidobacteriaceae bacterium]|nr:protein kinase [Acidobacteriaceae bacterium]MBV9781194.1 protein kinase [Acidobacteriaceae bacterium]
MPLAAGARLGPYEILAPIGAGGMGEVYKARDTRLDRMVAVKVSNEQFSGRFEREARAVAALNHSNICQLYDVGPNYLVMEYIEGTPLKGPLPIDRALKYASQICDALDAAHKKGITHRDLKPANILVTANGLKLLDFGVAQVGTAAQSGEDCTQPLSLTQAGTIVGTAAYMSPEQADAKPVDARSDVFSFGLVLYEMLTGRRAFQGDSAIAILAAILNQEPAPLGVEVPPEVRDIVTRCLRKSRADRFQSALELRAALESASAAKAREAQPSIAVLPFVNMSRENDEYFSDGLAEEIINVLAQIPGLKVIARTSAFAFRGKEQDIRKTAQALGVRNILEGSVRRAENRIRVTAQLISSADGSHLWSARYDREMADVFALQDEIAAAIAAALRIKLAVPPAAVRQYTPNLASYDALLRAWHHHSKYTPESMPRARQCLEQATALDPGYAPAHSALGSYFISLAVLGMMPAHEATPLARAALQKALYIDPTLPEALVGLGWIVALYDYNWKEADRLFRLAIASHPVTPKVHWYSGHYLFSIGRSKEAVEEIERALERDPLNVAYRRSLACCLLGAGREADAAEESRRILELYESEYWAYFLLSIIHARRGELEEAVQTARKAYSLAPWYSVVVATLAAMLMRTGDASAARTILQKLGDGQAYGAPLGLVTYYLLCSEIDSAADWAEKAIEQRDQALLSLLRLPYAKELRESARWPALAKMMNLPDQAARLSFRSCDTQ